VWLQNNTTKQSIPISVLEKRSDALLIARIRVVPPNEGSGTRQVGKDRCCLADGRSRSVYWMVSPFYQRRRVLMTRISVAKISRQLRDPTATISCKYTSLPLLCCSLRRQRPQQPRTDPSDRREFHKHTARTVTALLYNASIITTSSLV